MVNKLNINFRYMIIGAILVVLMGYLLLSEDNKQDYNQFITAQALTNALIDSNIEIIELRDYCPEDCIILDQQPIAVKLMKNDSTLLIYEFSTIKQRKEADMICDAKNYYNGYGASFFDRPTVYAVKNLLAIYVLDATSHDYSLANKIRDVAFSLNDAHKIVFQGNSDNWVVIYKIDYYENYYRDSSGFLYVDSYHITSGFLEYINKNNDAAEYIDYLLESPTERASGSGIYGNNKIFRLGESGSNGSRLTEDAELQITISWNGKNETIKLHS